MNKPLLIAFAVATALGFACYSLFDVMSSQTGAAAPTALLPMGAFLLLTGGAGVVLTLLFNMFQRSGPAV